MATFDDLVTEVHGHLRAYSRNQEMSTHLTLPIDASTRVITVAESSLVTRGRIEIDDEIIWVDSSDRQSGELTIPPYGRGMDGTTTGEHAIGTRVLVQPLYPRSVVKSVINEVIMSLAGQLYGVTTTELNADPTASFYEMPSDTLMVVSVEQSWPYLGGMDSELARRWRYDQQNKRVYVYDPVGSTSTMQFTRLVDPLPLSGDAEFTTSLLPVSCVDLVVLGAAARLLSSTASGHVNTRSIEANAMDSRLEPSYALQQAKYLQTLYMQRVQEELSKLNATYTIRTHYTG